MLQKINFLSVRWMAGFFMMVALAMPAISLANDDPDEALYRKLSGIAIGTGDSTLFDRLNSSSRNMAWEGAAEVEFVGNLRVLKSIREEAPVSDARIYLLRNLSDELYILSLPADPSAREEGADSFYAGLDEFPGNKMVFSVKTLQATVNGETYKFAQLTARPEQMKLDRIFKICIILMLFFVMVGMGMTLTAKEFTLIFTKPRGIILGEILQFGLMPFLVMYLAGLISIFLYKPLLPVSGNNGKSNSGSE